MTIEKSELRASAIHDLGARLDDGLEKVNRQKHEAMGAVSAYVKASGDIKVLKLHVQKDIDGGEMDMETAKIVLRWLDRSVNVCENLSVQARNSVFKIEGMEMGMQTAVSVASQMHGTEKAKGQRANDEVPSPEGGGRKKTIKQRRLAEDKKPVRKKAKKKTTKKKA